MAYLSNIKCVCPEEKAVVPKETTFDLLEIRIGRVIGVEEEPSAIKKAYFITPIADAKIGGKLF